MGCCVSSDGASSAPDIHRRNTYPPPVEEETVKEVLSETPSSKLYPKIQDEPKTPISKPSQFTQLQHKNNNVRRNKPTPVIHADEVPISDEVSEICSTLSESVSTTTFNNDDYGGNVIGQRVTERSPAKYRNRSFSGDSRRERVVGKKSPARGSEQSPSRIGTSPGRDGRGLIQRKELPESSGQRLRSPGNRAVVGGVPGRNPIGRSPSARKTGRSPGRVGSDLQERRIRRLEPGRSVGGREEWPPTTSNESLENPLVSLECFIFL